MSDEYRALRSGAGLWDRAGWHLRRFAGEKRVEFLHKFLTQEVRLEPGRGAHACALTAKGAMKGDLWIHLRAEDVLAVAAPGAETAFKHLRRFAMLDRVPLEDLAATHALRSVWGPTSGAALAATLGVDPELPHLHHVTQGDGLTIARNDLAGVPGWDVIGLQARVAEVEQALLAQGVVRVGLEAIEQVRVEAGVPLFGADMDEKTIPIEAGLEAATINYEKGCYLGQETIARVHYRGRVNRHLRGLLLPDAVEVPASLFQGEKEVGRVTSAVRSPERGAYIGLGLVHRKAMEAGTELAVGAAGGPTAVVADLPFA